LRQAAGASLDNRFAGASQTAADANAPVADRVRAIGLIAYDDFDRVKSLLNELLDPRQPPQVQRAAVAALSGAHSPDVAPVLLARWGSYTPAVRNDVITALLAYPNRLPPLLDAVEVGRVRATDIPASRRAATTQHADAKIRNRALKLFGEETRVDRKQIIEKFTPALDLAGDPARGRKVYQTLCITCHRLGDEGFDVGPNLATVRQWGPQQLLTNILDPNREVAPPFAEYVVQLNDGETLSGIVTEETGTSITLKMAGAVVRVLPRQSIQRIAGSRVSLMPEGLETGLTPQQIADLMALLRSPSPAESRAQ
jgi:putative heme-binding domain-containing protein